ncbi:hypothetical protein AAFF_G00304070 [Aldrovandia affinis]|uniref:Uncharacterized protein n=1 Tax=Aldrovandia affinis TaxID=143900 RepID=A0AAD7SR22_9TELE|nr:hypothetical protein AAFF_G00304070 [Aldrovandia affinis]
MACCRNVTAYKIYNVTSDLVTEGKASSGTSWQQSRVSAKGRGVRETPACWFSSMALMSVKGQLQSGNLEVQRHQQSLLRHRSSPSELHAT